MKGGMVGSFSVGDYVSFPITIRDRKRRPMGRGLDHGRIVKLHRSGVFGVAEIKPSDGTKKVSRRLQFVKKETVQ